MSDNLKTAVDLPPPVQLLHPGQFLDVLHELLHKRDPYFPGAPLDSLYHIVLPYVLDGKHGKKSYLRLILEPNVDQEGNPGVAISGVK